MKKILSILFLFLFIFSYVTYADEVKRFWVAPSSIGGGSGSADGAISGVSINATDRLIVITANDEVLFYKVTNDSATENYPYVMSPDDVGAGTTRWTLVDIASGVSTVRPIVGGVSVYNLTASQTLTREMMGGSFTGNYGAASEVTFTALPAFKGASFNISLDQDQTSGSTIWVILNSSDKILNEPDFVAGTGAGTSYFYLSGATGPSISLIGKDTNIWKVHEDANNGSITQGSVE